MDPDPDMETPIALALAPLVEIIRDPTWPQFNLSAYIRSLRDACAEIMHFETVADFCDTRLRHYFERMGEFHDLHGLALLGPHPGWRLSYDAFVQRITMWVHVQMVEVERFLVFVTEDKNLPVDVKIKSWDYQAELIPNIRTEPIEFVLGTGLSRLVHAAFDSYKAMTKHVKREGVYTVNEYVSHLDYVSNQDPMWIAYANLDGTMNLDDLLRFIDLADLDAMSVSQPVFALSYFNFFWEDAELTEPLIWMGRGSTARRTLESVFDRYRNHPDFGFEQAPMWDLDEELGGLQQAIQHAPDPEEIGLHHAIDAPNPDDFFVLGEPDPDDMHPDNNPNL